MPTPSVRKINGLDINATTATTAQTANYVAAGNVEGPQGYNSVENSNTASLALGVSTTAATFDTHSIALFTQGISTVYNSSGTNLAFDRPTQTLSATRINVGQISATGITGSFSGSIATATTAATASVALIVSQSQALSGIHRVALLDPSVNNTPIYYDHNGIVYDPSTNALLVYGPITASNFVGTASYATQAITASYALASAGTVINATSASFAATASRLQTVNAVIADNGSAIAISASNPSTKFVVNVPGNIELSSGASIIFGGSVSLPAGTSTPTASYVTQLNQNVTVNGNLSVFGTASYSYASASTLDVGTNTISVNVAEPAQRFGGLVVYDSGSSNATASFFWDSLHNHWVYQNASGSTYSGGMFMSGPRNTGSLGDEPTLTKWFIARSDGGDHLENTQIFSSASVHIVTGSLTVTGNVIATASWASNAITASYINPTFISASAAASGFGSGTGAPESDPIFAAWTGSAASYLAGTASFASNADLLDGTHLSALIQASQTSSMNVLSSSYALTASYALSSAGVAGGVTSITAGDGISVNQSTGAVTITNTGGGSGGTNLGLVYAVSIGYLMP